MGNSKRDEGRERKRRYGRGTKSDWIRQDKVSN